MIQKTLRLSAVALASLFAFGAAHAAVEFNANANVEQDNTYQDRKKADLDNAGNPVDNKVGLVQGGRVELNILGRATNGDAFVAGKASYMAGKSGSAGVDDMWVQFGTSAGDLKLGRFEGVDLYPVGRDTVLNRANRFLPVYLGQTLRGRVGGDTFHAEGTINAAPGVGIIIGVVERKEVDTSAATFGGQGVKGFRPAVTFSTGGINLKVGLEAGKVGDGAGGSENLTGVAITGGMALAGGNLNVNLANGKVKNVAKATTIGANYTMDLGPWALLEMSTVKADGADAKETTTTIGLGYQFSLMGVKNAFVTPALSYSTSKVSGADAISVANAKDTSVRVRFNYNFNAF